MPPLTATTKELLFPQTRKIITLPKVQYVKKSWKHADPKISEQATVMLVRACFLLFFLACWCTCYHMTWGPVYNSFDQKYDDLQPQDIMVDYINRLGLYLLNVRSLFIFCTNSSDFEILKKKKTDCTLTNLITYLIIVIVAGVFTRKKRGDRM